MNILYIANHLNSGGITSYLLSLASGMKEKGHNVFIAAHSGEKLDKFLQLGVNFIRIPIKTKKEIGLGVFLSFLKLKDECKKHKIDIVHSNSRTTQVVGCLLERFGKVPHLSTCHGFFKKRLLRRILPCWGRQVIAISQEVKEHLMFDFKIEESRIRVVNNGIDIKRFTPQPMNKQETYVIGIIARLSDVKGHIYLFQAMKIVLGKFSDALLLVVGEGKMYNTLLELAGRLKIKDNVRFILHTPDTRNELSMMDVFVMPSLKEGLGLALMEAMACAKPVVGSAVGGIKTLIKDKQNGLLVEPADPQALAAAIIELLSDRAKAAAYGQAASKFIAENFSLGKMVNLTEKVYQECVY